MTTWVNRVDGTTTWAKRTSNVTAAAEWTTSTRPTSAFNGQTGFNTDHDGLECYNGTAWLILSGTWTTATRPSTTGIAAGSRGFNTDTGMGFETWDGTNWRLG